MTTNSRWPSEFGLIGLCHDVFVIYAGILLVPVLLLGFLLGASYRAEARQRGLAEGQSEARLVVQTAVEPVLDGRPLSDGISPTEKADLERLVGTSAGTTTSSGCAYATCPGGWCSPTTGRASGRNPRMRRWTRLGARLSSA